MKKLFCFKPHLLYIVTCSLFLACTNSISDADKIILVETSLIPAVYFEGDSTWTIEERMEHYDVPGVSIAVIKDFKIEWAKSYGFTDKVNRLPVTNQTLFQAGSISKPVAAYGALKLVEQNKLDLNENVNNYLKSWKLSDNEFTAENKVALKHLLNHSGGITVHGFLGYSPGLPVPSLVEVLEGRPPANSPAIFVDKAPEESFRYSGGGYCIMQQMMIDVTRKPFPALLKELVLDPLGMNSSTYDQPLKGKQINLAATGYLPDGTMTKGKRHTYPEMAAAGLWTTAEDLARFAIDIQMTLKGESEAVLSRDMVAQMLTPFVSEFAGLGIFLDKIKDETYFGHGGWDEGFSSEMVAHKDKGYGVVVLTNSNHPEFISELIGSVAFTYEWDEYIPVYTKMETEIESLEHIAGRYKNNFNEPTLIFHNGNRLFRKSLAREPVELFKITDTTFITRENDRPVQFKINDETGVLNLIDYDSDHKTILSTRVRMDDSEILPIELLETGEFEKAFEAYQSLFNDDPDSPAINESHLNGLGYQYLSSEKIKMAKALFKINMLLYPNSSNVYDSYAEACMENGEYDEAFENFNKSLSLDPKNDNARQMIEKIQKERAKTENQERD